MDDRALRVLEFERILALLADRAATTWGRELCLALRPATEPLAVSHQLDETSEARGLWRAGKAVPLGGIRDLRPSLSRVERAGVLDPADLLDVADTVAAGRRLKKTLADEREECRILAALAGVIGAHQGLEAEIRQAITDEAAVADDASPQLHGIRRAIRVNHGRVREKLESMLKSASTAKYLQEPIVTVRDGRYVIPVKMEHRGQVPGIVHDQSASGQTAFIEPLAVVELNNDLRKLELEEKAEVARILTRLSALVAGEAGALFASCEAMAQIDFACAKGRLSQDLDAVRPETNRQGLLEIRRGRHPLLKGPVVPVDVHLGKTFDQLIITGPNTGGKTVTLKTVGLFCLMAQAGLHVPAFHGTELPVLDQLFCDIGDEQSIEQSLSTFSAHMTNIIRILDQLAGQALVLFDELGAGTDPTEGTALAMSLLEHLQTRGAKVIATTHYSELKTFAYTRPRAENASVEFDTESLRPTYRLLIGLPGRSNAFEIAQRLGLSPVLVARARQFLSKDEERVETLIRQIQDARAELEADRDAASRARAEALRLKEEHEQLVSGVRAKEREVLGRAQAQAQQLLAQVRRESEELIRELRQAQAQGQREEQARAIEAARARTRALRDLAEGAGPAGPPAVPGEAPKNLRPGELVQIVALDQRATVLAAPGADGQVLVQAGIMKLKVAVADLRRAEAPSARVQAPATRFGAAREKAQTVSPEVDLRGLTVEEALDKTDKYLDDAVLAGLPQVRIIHGKGTGALRQAIREYLRGHRDVESFRLGGLGEGGDGVTVAKLAE